MCRYVMTLAKPCFDKMAGKSVSLSRCFTIDYDHEIPEQSRVSSRMDIYTVENEQNSLKPGKHYLEVEPVRTTFDEESAGASP